MGKHMNICGFWECKLVEIFLGEHFGLISWKYVCSLAYKEGNVDLKILVSWKVIIGICESSSIKNPF